MLASLFADVAADCADAPELAALAADCQDIASWMIGASIDDKLAGSTAFCTMAAVAVAGWQLQRQAAAVLGEPGPLAAAKPVIAAYFVQHLVPEARGLKAAALGGAGLLYALDAAALTG